ncbi:GatB/YqeY domain-containing protein [Mesorhizobium sp. 10J20-29]
MRAKIAEALKSAQKAQDKELVSTLRMVSAAIQDRDILNRGTGKEAAGDDEILQILTKMVKQRQESAKAFEDGNRPELAAKENAEIAIISNFLPSQMNEAETQAAIEATISETGASGLRDMGKVMNALKEKYPGQMDFGKASGIVKSRLQ